MQRSAATFADGVALAQTGRCMKNNVNLVLFLEIDFPVVPARHIYTHTNVSVFDGANAVLDNQIRAEYLLTAN